MTDIELLKELEELAGGPLKCARMLAVDYTGQLCVLEGRP